LPASRISTPPEALPVPGPAGAEPVPAGCGRGRPGEVLLAFLRLGLTAFGGPVAHIGYFRESFVARRRWLDGEEFAGLLALCQFLPGPASSQLGFAIGLRRAGLAGGLAAWAGFTLPSALLMTTLAGLLAHLPAHSPHWAALLHGLRLVAVPVVAQALLGMVRANASGRVHASIAVAALAVVTIGGSGPAQLAAIAAGALAGLLAARLNAPAATVPEPAIQAERPALRSTLGPRAGCACLAAVALLPLFVHLAWLASGARALAVWQAFYRAGALVFGGGHVVLPLLQDGLVGPGWIDQGRFLDGYGAAQAVPGPLFSVASFYGTLIRPLPGLVPSSLLALVALFLPGLLLLLGVLPFWTRLAQAPGARAALAGANASVVGLLASAFYDPVWRSAITGPRDLLIASAGLCALLAWRAPPWLVVAGVLGCALL